MTLSRRALYYVGAAVAALVGAFAVGRSTAPVKVETRTETKYVDRVVEKVVTVKAKDVQRKVTTKTEKKPDGSSVVLKVEDTTSHADLGSVATADVTAAGTLSSQAETATGSRPGWRLGVGAEWAGAHEKPDAIRFEVDRRIVGPIWLGLRASTDRTAGAALSLEF